MASYHFAPYRDVSNGYMGPNDFWKLREVGANYQFSESLAARVGAERASFALSWRINHLLWRKYTRHFQDHPGASIIADPEHGAAESRPEAGTTVTAWSEPPISSIHLTLRGGVLMGPRGSFRRAVRVGLIVALPIGALTACDSLLEVDLPAQLTEDVLVDPAGVDAQVSAVIGLFECGYSTFTYVSAGMEDIWEPLVGTSQVIGYYTARGDTGECDQEQRDTDYYDQFSTARAQAVDTYDRLTNLWDDNDVDDREQKQAIMALYSAAALDIFGEFFCEMALDAGPLMTADETLAEGEMWIATALGHINNQPGGDFVMPFGIASSAKTMAYGLRARMRWARNDVAGALADALLVPMGFTAWVIRETALTRRNKQNAASDSPVVSHYDDVNTYWSGAPNPVTGQAWPSPIPFTGYDDLALLPDGRAVWDTGLPIRTAGVSRILPAEDAAVPDTRVATITRITSQGGVRHEPTKYPNADRQISPW